MIYGLFKTGRKTTIFFVWQENHNFAKIMVFRQTFAQTILKKLIDNCEKHN